MTHSTTGSRTLSVASLARVEGEGSMHVVVRDGEEPEHPGVCEGYILKHLQPPAVPRALLKVLGQGTIV